MMTFFDYVFYRIAALMKGLWHEERSMPQIRGIVGLTVFQFADLLGLLAIPRRLFGRAEVMSHASPVLVLSVTAAIGVLNAFRYLKLHRYEDFKARWGTESVSKSRVKGAAVIAYAILSLVVAVI